MKSRAEADRMLFYFDLKVDAEESSEDEERLELENEEAAQFEAAQLLCELSKETIRFKKQLQVGAVKVRDEQGPLFKAEINFKNLQPQQRLFHALPLRRSLMSYVITSGLLVGSRCALPG